jgi:hypothetical protein
MANLIVGRVAAEDRMGLVTGNTALVERRRSRRTLVPVQVLLKSLDPALYFAERCITLDVSSHGCRVRAPRPFINSTWISLELVSNNRLIAARVVRSMPVESEWHIGLELYRQERSWGKP